MVKFRPNFSAISSCHFSIKPGGQTTMIRLARCRSSSSSATRPASIVLPSPTSSASSRLTRGASMARATGSSWYGSTTTPDRSGDCRAFTSAEVNADQRTASRKAVRRSGGSKPSLVTSGSDLRGRMRRPGSTSQITGRESPYRPSSTLCRVSRVLWSSLPGTGSSPTTHLWPRTSTRLPAYGISSCVVVTSVPMPRLSSVALSVATTIIHDSEATVAVGAQYRYARLRRRGGRQVVLPGLTGAEG